MTSSLAATTRTDSIRKVSTAWFPFIGSLAAVLEQLSEDQFLILTAKGSNRFVQFYAQGSFGMRVEACLLYTSPSPRDISGSRMPSSA